MAKELKTKLNEQNPLEFLDSIEDPQKKEDSIKLLKLIEEWTKLKPEMWGKDIIGYGRLSFKYANGKENEWMKLGLSPRKQNITIYIMSGFGEFEGLLSKLGPHKLGKSCLYLKNLSDIDLKILKQIVNKSITELDKNGMFDNHKA
jgi:hypothetical protein